VGSSLVATRRPMEAARRPIEANSPTPPASTKPVLELSKLDNTPQCVRVRRSLILKSQLKLGNGNNSQNNTFNILIALYIEPNLSF